MAVTLAIFAAVQIATPLWIRPNLIPPSRTIATVEGAQANVDSVQFYVDRATGDVVHATFSLAATTVPGYPGAWITSSGAVNAAGQPVSALPAACRSAARSASGPDGSPALDHCLANHGIRVTVSYQPVSHYWPLQLAETAMFLVLALALAGYCYWRLGRRRS
jgi:hypothetical protein